MDYSTHPIGYKYVVTKEPLGGTFAVHRDDAPYSVRNYYNHREHADAECSRLNFEITAVNSHAALLEALEAALNELEVNCDGRCNTTFPCAICPVANKCRAAIRMAKGEK